jgi:transcriptional regulator with XRE-family HTH domain
MAQSHEAVPSTSRDDSRSDAGTVSASDAEELNQSLGRRLRALRMSTGRGLREQARLLQMSASVLSELEHGRGRISVQTLQRLSEAYGVHISDLLASVSEPRETDTTPEVVRNWANAGLGINRGKGAYYQVLNGSTTGSASAATHQIQPYLISLAPSGGYKEDKIGHPGEEFAFIIFGEVELLLGDEVITLTQGDAVRFTSGPPHAFRNKSSTGVALVVGAAAPPW